MGDEGNIDEILRYYRSLLSKYRMYTRELLNWFLRMPSEKLHRIGLQRFSIPGRRYESIRTVDNINNGKSHVIMSKLVSELTRRMEYWMVLDADDYFD